MAPLLLELSSLEVEPLEVVADVAESGQNSSLDTLTSQAEIDTIVILTGTFPVDAYCTCCCE